jgi:hypothetical protein
VLEISSALRKVSSVNLSSTEDFPTLEEPIRSSLSVTTGPPEVELDAVTAGVAMFARLSRYDS